MSETYAGEFRVLAYGSRTPEELFTYSSGAGEGSEYASMSGKKDFVSIFLPAGVPLSEFLDKIRTNNPDDADYTAVRKLYADPDGPAIAVRLDYPTRFELFKETGLNTPSVAVLFIGTNHMKPIENRKKSR